MSIIALITAFINGILAALGLVKEVMPSESEKEAASKAALDNEIADADKTGGPSG